MGEVKIKYDLSDRGFLSKKFNVKLPDEYDYLILLLEHVDLVKYYKIDYDLPDLDIYHYDIIKEIYTITSIITHKYIVYLNRIKNANMILPLIVAKPFYESSKILGINSVLTHSAVDLWNWKFKESCNDFKIDNIKSKYLMSDNYYETETENWFYMIMTAIEGECGNLVFNMLNITNSLENKNISYKKILGNLEIINDKLKLQINILNRIYEKCDKNVFYYKIRKYLWGYDKLENGLILEGISKQPIKFKGGSASQSALIHLEDIFFDIVHNDEYLLDMRNYMTKKHRSLLDYFISKKNLLKYLQELDYSNIKNTDKIIIEDIKNIYNNCIKQIFKFRKCHYIIVKKYVIEFEKKNINNIRGTGGTQ